MFRSIRWSLQLWHAGILGLALASFGTALYFGVREAQFAQVDSELEGAARVFVDATATPGAIGPDIGGQRRGGGRRGGGFGGFGGPGGGQGGGGPGPDGGFNGGGGPNGGFNGGGFNGQNPDRRPTDLQPGMQDGNFDGGPPNGGGGGGGGGRGGGGGGGGGGFGGGGPGGGFGGGQGPAGGFGGGPGRGPNDHGPNDRGPGGPNPFVGSKEWWDAVPEDTLRRIGENEQDQPYFIVYGFDGAILRASSNAQTAPAPDISPLPPNTNYATLAPAFRTRADLREVTLHLPWGEQVLVGKSLNTVHNSLAYLRWELLGAGAAVMAIGLCGGWVLSLRATRPIRSISDTARSISATDLSKRITVDKTDSELGSLAATLNDTFERLQTAFERQIRFTADASHELRTPLSVIHSQAELSLSRERSAPEYKQSLETCLRAAKRMKSLVESLLVLARADAGKLVINAEKFDLAPAAEECLLMVGTRAAERRVTLESHIAPVSLEADRTKIMQLITNLLVNAIQYNRDGGTVTLAISATDKQAILSVADTGVGISPEDQVKIFERFFRADKARSRDAGGSGLGLAICRSITEAHAGTISFSSTLGQGTTFTVRLPLSRPPHPPASESPPAPPLPPATP